MKHDVLTVALYPKPNVHWQDSPVADVWAVVKLATLGGLVLWILAVLVMS